MYNKPWSNLDIKFIKLGICPNNRSIRACRVFCKRHGVEFPGKKVIDENNKIIQRLDEKYSPQSKGIEMKKENKTITASIKDAKPEKPKQGKERSYSFRTISADKILNGNNIRAVNDIADLVESIEAHGIINPITVTPQPGMPSVFHIVAGFRRFAAAQKLGIEKIPCHVIEGNDETPEIALSENVNRINMTPYEECKAVKNLVNKKNTVQQIARKFGRTLRWVLVRKKLADAGDKVLDKVKEGTIELAAAARLADLPDDVFKKEMNSCYRTDKYFVEGVLERYHKDLSRAPFEHIDCLKCANCSACQKDLFEDEPKAYCLDLKCWAKKTRAAAKDIVNKLTEEGRNARLGKFSGNCISCEDEADKYEISKRNSREYEKAKEAGIQKRVLVDAGTCKKLEYYDKRDLPDYHEETDEEREQRLEIESMDARKKSIHEKLMRERLQDGIANICVDFKSQADIIVTLLVFAADNYYQFFDEEGLKKLGIDGEDENGYDKALEDMPADKTYRDVAEAVRFCIGNIVKSINDMKMLKKLYTILVGNIERIQVTEEDIQAEIKLQDELRANEDADDDDGDSEEIQDEESTEEEE